jgi:NAD(P)H-dependent FMN reductase
MTTLLLVPGSQRRDSYNARLLRDMAGRLTARCAVDWLTPGDVALPLFDQDLEADSVIVERVAAVHRRFEACDGIIVASPEYNGLPTPYLKNLIDWVSRLAHIDQRFDNPFLDRPLLLCSASTGASGGWVGMAHARALFTHVGCAVTDDFIGVPHAQHAWTGDAFDFDPFFAADVDAAVARLLELASARRQPTPHQVAAA